LHPRDRLEGNALVRVHLLQPSDAAETALLSTPGGQFIFDARVSYIAASEDTRGTFRRLASRLLRAAIKLTPAVSIVILGAATVLPSRVLATRPPKLSPHEDDRRQD
jgi:hypothetical protein